MKRGFTLIELMTAIAIFTIVMTISMGSILNVFDANRKSRSLKTVLNNLNLVVESMSREMRYGKDYRPSGNTAITFLSSDGVDISYSFNNNSIEKKVGNGPYIAMTAPEIIIDDMVFYTRGEAQGDAFQPKVIMKIKSHAGSGRSRSDFTLQTMVSQRVLDRNI